MMRHLLFVWTAFLLSLLAAEDPPPGASTKALPPGYTTLPWKPPCRWDLRLIKLRYSNPQEEDNICQNKAVSDGKPPYAYLCDPNGLLRPSTKSYIARNITTAAKETELCNVNATKTCGGLRVGVAIICEIAAVRGEDLNGYMKQYSDYLLTRWNHMGSNCSGGILLLVSVNDGLMYVSSQNGARQCTGGCSSLWTDGPRNTSKEHWQSDLENITKEYANFAQGQHECCQGRRSLSWLPYVLFLLLLLPILLMVFFLWRDFRRQLSIQIGTFLIELGLMVLAIVLVWRLCERTGFIPVSFGFFIAIICIILLPRVVMYCRIRQELTRVMQRVQNVVADALKRAAETTNSKELVASLNILSQDLNRAISNEIERVKRELHCKCCVAMSREDFKAKIGTIFPNLQTKFRELVGEIDISKGDTEETSESGSIKGVVTGELDKVQRLLDTELRVKLDELVTSLFGDDKGNTVEANMLSHQQG